MKNEEKMWILYGVFLAFLIQVIYDFIGVVTNDGLIRIGFGSLLCLAVAVCLFIGQDRLKKKTN